MVLRLRLDLGLYQGLFGMLGLGVRARASVMHYDYESLYKDMSPSVCVRVCKATNNLV